MHLQLRKMLHPARVSASVLLHSKWPLSKVPRPVFPRAIRWDTGVRARQPQQGSRQARTTEPHSGDSHVLMTGHSGVGVHPAAMPAPSPFTAPSSILQCSPFSHSTKWKLPD